MRPAICELTITSFPVTIPVSGISFSLGVVARYTTTEMANSTPTKTKNLDNFIMLGRACVQGVSYSFDQIVYGRNIAATRIVGRQSVDCQGLSAAEFGLRGVFLEGLNPQAETCATQTKKNPAY